MVESSRHHSIKIDKNKCIGCVTCMKACPTKAIRVHKKTAQIIFERCIDCGECLRVCEYDAVIPITTSPSDLTRYQYKVALPSPVLFSQFGPHIMPNAILSALKDTGFDYVYDEALMCEMISLAIQNHLEERQSNQPVISSSCPVAVRLIQRLFPGLCELIIPIEPPREVAAKHLRKEISQKHHLPKEDIGIIHITPCAAKMVSINYPATLNKSHLNGAISIQDIYNDVMMKLKKSKHSLMLQTDTSTSGIGIGWALAGGEIRGLDQYHAVSVAGVHDTIRILEDVEAGRIKDIRYLECLICPDGCIGGPLTVENRFIAKSNILRLIKIFGRNKRVDDYSVKSFFEGGAFSFERGVEPRPFPPLADNPGQALKKLQLKEDLIKKLPGTDCGICGSPDCRTFAEDIARGGAKLEDCLFIKQSDNHGHKNYSPKKNRR